MRRSRCVGLLAMGCALAMALAGCETVGPGPIVVHTIHDVRHGALARVAVVPFHPAPLLAPGAGPTAVSSAEAAALVSRIVTEALVDAGIPTVPPSDLVLAFEGTGKVVPRGNAAANASIAAREFGATAVVLGRVMRYREREGGAAGALAPASVHFQVEVYTAPDAQLLHEGRFDHTQRALSSNVLLARQYPGGGTRWLTVAELTRWGADEFIATLPRALLP